MDKVDAYMKRWHEHQRELKEGGAMWCLACLEYGHLPEVCPYEDPLFVQAFDRGEVETAEEWIHLKAIPSPQVDQETCLTCLKGEEWCFAVGKVGHKPPDQPPPWQEVELLVPKKAKKQAPVPEGEREDPAPRRGEPRASSVQKGGARASSAQKGGARASSAQKGGARASSARRGGARASSARRGGARASSTRKGGAHASRAHEGRA
ncbi:UNVERIFIED_CONTAM: hypothetical protein FKN15_020852 [Acipenser sinensis]